METSESPCITVVGSEPSNPVPYQFQTEVIYSVVVSSLVLLILLCCICGWCYRRRAAIRRAYTVVYNPDMELQPNQVPNAALTNVPLPNVVVPQSSINLVARIPANNVPPGTSDTNRIVVEESSSSMNILPRQDDSRGTRMQLRR